MSLSTTQASATQKLLDHIRSTPPKDASGPTRIPPLPAPAAPRRSLFGGERTVVGIAVGKGTIGLAQRRTGGVPLLEAVRIVSAPDVTGWETPGCAEKVREALDAFLPDGRREADIWVHLPEGQAELRHYRMPKVSPKDRDAIAKMTAIREKAFDENENLFDYRVNGEVLDKGVPRQPVTAMIASKEAVETLRQRLTSVGISPAGITPSSICVQNLFASGWLSSPWEHFALANIEEDSTRIEIFSGATIALSRTIKTGLRSLVTALQESNGHPPNTAVPPAAADAAPRLAPPPHLPMDELGGTPFPEGLPLRLQPQVPSNFLAQPSLVDAPPVFAVPDGSLSYEEGLELLCRSKRRTTDEENSLLMRLAQPLGRLARQLERTADHFRNAMGMPNIQGVIVFAPGGCLSLALKKFESALGLPCRPLRFDGQASSGATTDMRTALTQTADDTLLQAIGLSLSAPDYTPNAIMTYAGQRLRERRMRITFLSFGVTTVALALLLAFCGKLYFSYQDGKRSRAELEARIAAMGPLYEPEQLKDSLNAVQQVQTQARIMAKRRIAAALMTELSLSTPDTVHLTGLRVTFKDATPGKKAPQPARRGAQQTKPEAQESAVAVLTGTVTGDMLQRESRLAEFLSQMEHSPMVLSLLVEKQQTDTEILSFVATLRLV